MAFYTIDFAVTEHTVTPDTPQMAGYTGDHRAAVVRFSVPFEGYRYRLEIADGGGGYDITDLLDATNGVVSYTIPSAWTTAGVAALRLVTIEQGENGDECVRFHSAPAYLLFADREDGTALGDTARPAWQETLDEAQFFLESVAQKLENGELKGDKGDKGDAPQKGVDYYTDAEKEALVAELGVRDVDQELDEESSNAVANKVVTNQILSINGYLGEVEGRLIGAESTVSGLRDNVSDMQEGIDAAHTRITDVDERLMNAEYTMYDVEVQMGDIEAALNGILAIQNGLIGGAAV